MRSSSSARTARCRARPLRPYASAQAPSVALNPQPEPDPDASPHPSPRQALHDRYNGTQERYDELHRKQVADSAELQALRERGSSAEVRVRARVRVGVRVRVRVRVRARVRVRVRLRVRLRVRARPPRWRRGSLIRTLAPAPTLALAPLHRPGSNRNPRPDPRRKPNAHSNPYRAALRP